MDLKIIHSTAACEDTACPTIYQDKLTGNFVIQGYILTDKDKEGLGIPTGEDVVLVPEEFLQEYLAKQKA